MIGLKSFHYKTMISGVLLFVSVTHRFLFPTTFCSDFQKSSLPPNSLTNWCQSAVAWKNKTFHYTHNICRLWEHTVLRKLQYNYLYIEEYIKTHGQLSECHISRTQIWSCSWKSPWPRMCWWLLSLVGHNTFFLTKLISLFLWQHILS